jgi:hypothetical protein
LKRNETKNSSKPPSTRPPRPLLSEVDIHLEKALDEEQERKRHGDEKYDIMLGHSYKQMVKMTAWKHLHDSILTLREEFVQALISGEDGAEDNRKAIWLLESLLRVPSAMIANCDEAQNDRGDLKRVK